MSPEQKIGLDDLIDRARCGEKGAISELLLRYRALVYSTQARIIGPTSDNQDLLQEAFARALSSIRQLKETRGFSNWLQRIAANVAIDYLRKQKQNSWLSFAAPDSLPDVEEQQFDETGSERLARIYVLLSQLPLEERAAFSLRWLAEQELTEVAVICKCSLATAKRRIKKGQQKFSALALRDPILSEYWGSPEASLELPGGAEQ